MFCVKCGSEILDNGVRFCSKCGNAIETGTEDDVKTDVRKRHGFTSFWLVFSLIWCAYQGVGWIVTSGANRTGGTGILYGLSTIAIAFGIILLLRWKKIGFWLFVGSSIVSLLLVIPMMGNTTVTTGETDSIVLNIMLLSWRIISIAIMWGVLHIHKNGKNTWEQLDPFSKHNWF
jgi:hypothetical protein